MVNQVVPVDVFHEDWEELKRFDSLTAFAKFINTPYTNLMWAAKHKVNTDGSFTYKDYLITRLQQRPYVKKVTEISNTDKRRRGCTVKCVDTNEYFSSIKETARALNINSWNLIDAFRHKGFYIAKDGKKYIKESIQKAYNLKNTIKEKVQELTNVDDTVILKEVCKRFIENRKYEAAFNIVEALQKID